MHRQAVRRLPRDLSPQEGLINGSSRIRKGGRCEASALFCVGRFLFACLGLRLTSSATYLVTWPRISPPGLAAVWTLT